MFPFIQQWCDQYFGWLNWEAVAAVGTIGTLIWALLLASSQSRAARRKDRSTLEALVKMSEPAWYHLGVTGFVLEDCSSRVQRDEIFQHVRTTVEAAGKEIGAMEERLARIDPFTMPTPEAVAHLYYFPR